jgi:predicted nucleotidyltransferase
MDKRSIKRIIKYLEERLVEKHVEPTQINLFGLQAKRNAHKDSDVDLIIVSESFRKKGLFKRVDMIGDAVAQTIYHFRVPIDVLLKTPEEIDSDYLRHIGAIIFAA